MPIGRVGSFGAAALFGSGVVLTAIAILGYLRANDPEHDMVRYCHMPESLYDDAEHPLAVLGWVGENIHHRDVLMFVEGLDPARKATWATQLDAAARAYGIHDCPLSAVWRRRYGGEATR